MADYSSYKPITGDSINYPTQYDNFIDDAEAVATEVENAREAAGTLISNLTTNYAKYSLSQDINGISTYKCINMPNPVDPQDYATKYYLDNLVGSAPTDITGMGPGALNPNDRLVINAAGTAITGRPTSYWTSLNGFTPITANFSAAYNDNIHFNVSGGGFSIYLPAGIVGGIVNFADIEGTVSATNVLTVDPATGERIMGLPLNENLLVNAFPNVSFGMVYVSASFGWSLTNLQR